MKVHSVPFKNTGYFSNLITDYLDKNKQLNDFYGNYPDMEGFKNQLNLKGNSFTISSRKLLVEVLRLQYKSIKTSKSTLQNIASLSNKNTFTITTGHQLNLFTGPLYFLYKIITAINLSKKLKKDFPKDNFVPVYWMATEDHDFEEIQFFNYKNKKICWESNESGAVGRFQTTNFEKVFEEFSSLVGNSNNAIYLKELFKKAYFEHNNLSEATRFLANELFKDYGLVIVDGDNKLLKSQFIPIIKSELVENTSLKEVSKTSELLKTNYNLQVNPREINLFYLTENIRERIVFEQDKYKVINTPIEFSKEEILLEVDNHPERFSPNVLMRPLYQEICLPNLCYIGGGGELAYWLQLKGYFDAEKVPFPILLLRNSLLLISEQQEQKLKKLTIDFKEVFLPQNELVTKKVTEISAIKIDFSSQKELLVKQFESLKELAKQTDYSFLGAVFAQEKKQINGLNNLEKRLLKAQKRKLVEVVSRVKNIQNELFPNGSLEERTRNFSDYYLTLGNDFIPLLIETIQPLKFDFKIVVY